MRGEVACGGSDRWTDLNAPKVIRSKNMTRFFAESSLTAFEDNRIKDLSFVSAFAVKTDGGTYCFLAVRGAFGRTETRSFGLIRENLFSKLVRLTNEHELAKHNGEHSFTHGLPDNFGGSVHIEYASGEYIRFENNQTPVFSVETGERIVRLFRKALRGEREDLPSAEDIRSVCLDEKRDDGGSFRTVLSQTPDGACTFSRGGTGEKSVSGDRMEQIRRTVSECGMLAFSALPQDPVKARFALKTLTFVFADGRSLSVPNDRLIPEQLGNAFFEIEQILRSE